MPIPKPWPYHAKEVRDRTAETLAGTLTALDTIITLKTHDREEAALQAAKVKADILQALRLLESIGATTRP